jgi:DNA-binding beta-propeller fold protein YncE
MHRGVYAMQRKKIKTIVLLTGLIVLLFFADSYASETVELQIHKTMEIDAEPVDVSLSPDGKRLFVLTDNGDLLIYSSSTGKLANKIEVGQQVDQITVGPGGEVLILKSRKNKTVQVITLDFIQKINVSGSPFKGSENAAVAVAVFNDFE